MKTKNTFRVLIAAIFVLGAMALNAQTKIYVHQTGGIDKTYNLADVDSISLNPLYIPVIPVTGVTLSSATLSLIEGQTSTLTATIEPANASNKSVTWSSDNEAVAKVSASGVVTAVAASANPANITATTNDGGFTKSCAVTVTAASAGTNLLQNPGFSDPAEDVATLVNWTALSLAEVTADEPEVFAANPFLATTGKSVSSASVAAQRSSSTFWTTNFYNPATAATDLNLTPHNGEAGRLLPAGNIGMYQSVNVEAGKTYAFSAYILRHRQNGGNQVLIKDFLRIKSEVKDDAGVTSAGVTLAKVPIADASGIVQEGVWMYISGTVTIPSDATYTTVRFQISQLDYVPTPGSKAGGTAIDDCDFHLIN